MKMLITGGSGFVGGALCAGAVSRGWQTVSLSRRESRHGSWIKADLTQPISLDYRPDVVVHAAARSSPWGTKSEFDQQNVRATRNVLEFCKQNGRPHLVYISSSAVLYRNEHQYGLPETTPPPARFINEYARTKYAGEVLVGAYEGRHTILRPRAVFGPGDSVLFPRILRAARTGNFPLIESSEPVMADLIYIDSLVEYIFRSIELNAAGTYHLTNNCPVQVMAFLTDLFAQLGLPAPRRRIKVSRAMAAATVVEGLYRFLSFLGEPPITRFGVSVFAYSKTLDVSKCLRAFGPPSVSTEEGVARFVRWQKEQP